MSADRRGEVGEAIRRLAQGGLRDRVAELLGVLGYASGRTLQTGGGPHRLLAAIHVDPSRFEPFGGTARWRSLDVVFQVTEDELSLLARGAGADPADLAQGDVESLVFLALDLEPGFWTRRQLVGVTRELNRGFAMPAIVVFRYGGRATVAVIDRRSNRSDPTKDVVGGKISLIRDIDLASPHRAHIEILASLALDALQPPPMGFRGLYDAWLDVLSASELNKRFYKELADWFAFASRKGVVAFPPGQGNEEGERQVGLIRLLTRLMFVWFIKQKGLVPDQLFDETALAGLLCEKPGEGAGYYLAILQNLFFACLNTEMDGRGWLPRTAAGATSGYLVHTHLRHRRLFAEPDKALALFSRIPFLNGGLFDCLDVQIAADDPRAAKARREGQRGLVLRVDGFSEEPERQARVPDRLFFGGEKASDLSAYYGRPVRRDAPGVIDVFKRYKFTVEENTPLEEEAALDPELLGKVFENLLASYNEDTRETARKKSGSFYTPREVVDFMVDEALTAWLAPKLAAPEAVRLRPRAGAFDFGPAPGELALQRQPAGDDAAGDDGAEERVRLLLSWTGDAPAFTDPEAEALVAAIESCRAIDPAVGSGAFPLGLLQKLVHVLARLDPSNAKWKARNRAPLERALAEARATPSPADRAQRVDEAEERLAAFDATFDDHAADYARKLFLIERCLHGVDIQPIAVQIAKLRCFIALAVEQAVDDSRPNRGITPLPNLELKFIAANSLGFVGTGGELKSKDIIALEEERRRAREDFFTARTRKAKRRARDRLDDVRQRLADELAKSGFPAEDAKALAAWDPFDANAAAPFFDPEWMFGLGDHEGAAFDLAIANPPYIRQEKIEGLRLDGGIANPKAVLKEHYETYTGTADLYVFFYERAVRLLKPGGAIAFITSNKWYRSEYGAKLRAFLAAETRLRSIIDFGDAPVFEAIAYPTILAARRRPVRASAGENEKVKALNWPRDEPAEGFPERFAAEAFAMPQKALTAAGWQLATEAKDALLTRLRSFEGLRAATGHRVARGITTGLNEAFVIDGAKRAELIAADPGCEAIIKPFLRGRDVKRWRAEWADRWLIKIASSANETHPWSNLLGSAAEAKFSTAYPSIYQWWASAGLRERLIRRDDQGTFFWELRSCAYWREFEQPKIISTKVTERPSFAVDSLGYVLANTAYYILSAGRLHSVCALLNSKIGDFLARATFVEKEGGFYEVQPAALEAMPIPAMSGAQESLLLSAAKLASATAAVVEIESLIDSFACELYLVDDPHTAGVSVFAAAREAGLEKLAGLTGPALARAADDWARILRDPDHPLARAIAAVRALDPVRIIEAC